jgi:hypothetical protein
MIGVISLIGDQDAWKRRGVSHHEVEALVVRDFATGDLHADRETVRVGAEMDFGREATF